MQYVQWFEYDLNMICNYMYKSYMYAYKININYYNTYTTTFTCAMYITFKTYPKNELQNTIYNFKTYFQ